MKSILFNVVERYVDGRSLGVYRIAHVLRENNWDVEVIDYATFWTLDELKQLFQSRYTKDLNLVGFSHLFSYWTDTMEEFCSWLKENYPSVQLISGSTNYPMFDSKHIDYYVRGYGEHAVIELLNYMFSNGPRPKFVIPPPNGKRIIDANLSYPAFPMPNLTVRYEDRDFVESHESLPIETSRGCKFSCDFCSFPVLGVKNDHTRSADDFDRQIRENYDRFGITKFTITDETFNDSTEKITKYANIVDRLPFEPFFSGYIRGDLLVARPHDREELLRMRFLGQFYGVESFNTPSAKSIGKGMPGERLKQGLIDAKNYYKSHGAGRYRGTISLILGLPHETKETLEESKQWLIANWQGEHFQSYALALQRSDMKGTLSKISQEYEKYGYSIDDSKLNLTPDQERYFLDIMNWKNPHMTFKEAIEISDSLASIKTKYDFRISVFGLHERFAADQTIDDLLSYRLNSGRPKPHDILHVARYISKKLNLA